MTPQNSILLVQGRKTGKWSFPKGHKNRSETYFDCAIRETVEETGINLVDKTPVAYHKLSVGEYFFFELDEEIRPMIQDTSEIIQANWVPLHEISRLSCNVDVNNFLDRLNRKSRGLNHN